MFCWPKTHNLGKVVICLNYRWAIDSVSNFWVLAQVILRFGESGEEFIWPILSWQSFMIWLKILLLLFIAIDVSLTDACYECTDSAVEARTLGWAMFLVYSDVFGMLVSSVNFITWSNCRTHTDAAASVIAQSVDRTATSADAARVKRAAAATTTTQAPVKTTKVKTTKAPRTTTTEPPPPIKWSPILGLCIPFAIILIIVIALHVFRMIRR